MSSGASVQAFDPEAVRVAKGIFGSRITYAAGSYDAVKGADALGIVTEWNEFRTPDFSRIADSLKNKAIFDGRNLFDLGAIKDLGFHYESVGRETIN